MDAAGQSGGANAQAQAATGQGVGADVVFALVYEGVQFVQAAFEPLCRAFKEEDGVLQRDGVSPQAAVNAREAARAADVVTDEVFAAHV